LEDTKKILEAGFLPRQIGNIKQLLSTKMIEQTEQFQKIIDELKEELDMEREEAEKALDKSRE
jgi:hypothetical protein